MMLRTVALGVFLAAYGNSATLIAGNAVATDGSGVGLALPLLGVMLGWARFGDRLTARELGLSWNAFIPSAGFGLLLALGAALPALLFLRFPPLVGHAVEYSPLGSLSHEALVWRAFVWMPLDTAIPEEIAFRGVFLAALRRRLADLPAVLISAAVFAAWHGVIVTRTIALTNLQAESLLTILGVAGAFIAIAAGGVLFAWLRLATGHLAGSMVAHWAFNAVVLLGLGWAGA
jgi:tRNA pseudouridine32 synthase/23S rRNA pseudouridine746 synthase